MDKEEKPGIIKYTLKLESTTHKCIELDVLLAVINPNNLFKYVNLLLLTWKVIYLKMNSMQHQNTNPELHSLQPYKVINLQYQIWNALFGSIPKIIFVLGDTEFNFISLAQYLGCSFEALYKF